MEPLQHQIDYLRISVTDRCDERCRYCRPRGYAGWSRPADPLTAGEIIRIVGVAAALGVRKFRLTGGEPLVRPDLLVLVRGMAGLPGVEWIGLSTNGTRLAALAAPLREAGLRTVNVSLDALDPQVYRQVTGGELTPVLAGLRAAIEAGFDRVKLNCVLVRGVTEKEIWPLALFAAEHDLPLRLIELMPVTNTGVLADRQFMPVAEAMRLLGQRDELAPQPGPAPGWGPARYYRLKHTGALVGFIGAMTCPDFCSGCNKLRLTAEGKLRPCLGDHLEVDLRPPAGSVFSEEDLGRLLLSAMRRKPAQHTFQCRYQPGRPMTAIGG